jgi:integrase
MVLPPEETALREAISLTHPERLAELDIAIHTGMRRGEQFNCEWSWVDLDSNVLTVPKSKHGEKRRAYLNSVAVAALRTLWRSQTGRGGYSLTSTPAAPSRGPGSYLKMPAQRRESQTLDGTTCGILSQVA